MNARDIYTWDFAFGPHPAVVISHPSRIQRQQQVNVLKCSTHEARRAPEVNELLLDEADGLDWPTLCSCDLIYAVNKSQLYARRGSVTPVRRRAIVATILRSCGWLGL